MGESQGRREKRIALTLTIGDYNRLVTFANVTGKPPAVAARNILIEYLDTHEKDIDEAQRAAANYHAALKNLNTRAISLFTEA